MDRLFLGFLFVLSAILAVVFLNQLQNLPLSVGGEHPPGFWDLVVFGYGSAAMAIVSGAGLALLSRR